MDTVLYYIKILLFLLATICELILQGFLITNNYSLNSEKQWHIKLMITEVSPAKMCFSKSVSCVNYYVLHNLLLILASLLTKQSNSIKFIKNKGKEIAAPG